MILSVIDVKYIEAYKIWISFDNGNSGTIDLKDELYGEVFEPLNDIELFKTVKLHPIMESIYWENGADFAPEHLLDILKNKLQNVG